MHRLKILGTCLIAFTLSACTEYVKRTDYDADLAVLRTTDADLQANDEDMKVQLQRMQAQFGEMTSNLQSTFENYDAQIASLQGRVRVDMSAHFKYDDATLREQDKAALADFSDIVREYHPNIIVTVEGFTDPAGSAEYNKWLGLQRAKSVREYLIQSGLPADKVRAVSYGEDKNRQVAPGAWGDAGSSNRRVALVIDYVAG